MEVLPSCMSKMIRIVMVEDDPASVELVQRELRTGGIDPAIHRVETKQEFLQQLQQRPPDLILSDHGLPEFDGFSALAIAQAACPAVPFVFVTGRRGEEEVVEALQRGASDYVLKDRLSRLRPAIERALLGAESIPKSVPSKAPGGITPPRADWCLDALFATAVKESEAPDKNGNAEGPAPAAKAVETPVGPSELR